MPPPQSPVSLPPSVESDSASQNGSSNGHESDVSLPSSVEPEVNSESCCKRRCQSKFSASIDVYRLNLTKDAPQGGEVHHQRVYNQVLTLHSAAKNKTLKYDFGDTVVCRRFWLQCHCIGQDTLRDMLKYAKSGHPKLPPKEQRQPRSRTSFYDADEYLLHLYKHLAEPFATFDYLDASESSGKKEQEHEVMEDVNHPLVSLSVCVTHKKDGKTQHTAPKRYLNFSSYRELWSHYQQDTDALVRISKSCFLSCYKSNWEKVMPLHPQKTHSKCTTCAQLAEERQQCLSKHDTDLVDARKTAHINSTMSDRQVNIRGNRLASRPENYKDSGPDTVMKLMIDGMDQAKCLLPRPKNFLGTSSWSQLWKPAQHVTGVIAFGLLEVYFLLPPDCAKDSNMNAYLVGRTLELIQQMEGIQLPANLLLAADNTPRESKNQYFCLFCAMLAGTTFSSVELQYMQAGRTHNELDQRFSSIAKSIQNANLLQTPQDLASHLQKSLKPMGGRQVIIELVENTLDFQQWLYSANVQIRGLVSTQREPRSNHVWRFCRRKTLNCPVENKHPEWQPLPAHGDDVCLILKQYMHSPHQF